MVRLSTPKKKLKTIFDHLEKKYPHQEDPWGLNLKEAKKNYQLMWPLYKHYFRTKIFGKENVEDKPYLVVSNHSGQIAIDGMLICMAFMDEMDPPRILRPMVERFFTGIPFIGSWATEAGAVLGDRQNCINLLENNESVLIFPEGVKGIAKSTKDYYKIQKFTRGFYRIALKANVEILPISVVGAEEFFPYVYHPMKVAKLLGLPALPLSLNLLPLPSPVDIHIGKPISLPVGINSDSTDYEIDSHIFSIKKTIHDQLVKGLEMRRSSIVTKLPGLKHGK